ncbi:uncharacterized protein LOC136078689 [Hydra vulgaris]|uniref:Uncharacterized protein LOC136078689 n=1 Tax=Hydra vulgaris TaxID=6087 RepID=A0ABM4BN86_HYDVU
MDKYLRPERFDSNHSSGSASKESSHWFRTFTNFMKTKKTEDKLDVLINYLSPSVFDYITDIESFDGAIEILENLFVKSKNELFSRHQLASRKQSSRDSIDEFLQALHTLSKDCNFKQVSASEHCEEYICDSFINGLSCHHIRQRLLENSSLKLTEAYNQARSLENVQINNELYSHTEYNYVATINKHSECITKLASVSTKPSGPCYFCGSKCHPRQSCPARDAEYNNCGKKGHFKKVCKSSKNFVTSAPANFHAPSLASITCSSVNSLNSIVYIFIARAKVRALFDTGSSKQIIM